MASCNLELDVSVQSTARSRLANIYSGQTGFDIYTRAASDVYQDLYGEGIFVGKGIYEVDTLHGVLDRRFPRNALLSHDLIEGAYARAGLVSDIEIIEDYPSHYCCSLSPETSLVARRLADCGMAASAGS